MVRNLSTSNLFEPNKGAILDLLSSFNEDYERIEVMLEQELKAYHNADYCISFSTGFWALVAAARILRKAAQSEVIIPSLTYRRLADVAFWAGLKPVFVDVDPITLAISPSAISGALSANTALILAVHPIVRCCDVQGIIELATAANIPVLFDAVESVHETIIGKRVGSFYPAEVFSLHASKLLNGIEGGYVCTNDRALAQELTRYRNGTLKGSIPLKINPIHALFALQGLREIDKNISHNQKIYNAYQRCLLTSRQVELLQFDEREQTAFKNIVARVIDNNHFTRDELVYHLNQSGIMARSHYSPPLHDKEHSFETKTKELSTTDILKKKYINLPCGQRVTLEDVEHVCNVIESFGNDRK